MGISSRIAKGRNGIKNPKDRKMTLLYNLLFETRRDSPFGEDTYYLLPCFKKHLGYDIGTGNEYNTSGSSLQILDTLFQVEHPVLNDFLSKIEKNNLSPQEIDAEPLIRNKIMRGIKTLDLGCGLTPSYANVVHLMGAKSYTVDQHPQEHIRFIDNSMRKNHIQIDLNSPTAIKILKKKTGGDFDIVGSFSGIPVNLDPKSLRSPTEERMEEIYRALLKT